MSTRFARSGSTKNLEETITCHRQALALRPRGHPDRSSSLYNLAVLAAAMATRFEQLGRMDDF